MIAPDDDREPDREDEGQAQQHAAAAGRPEGVRTEREIRAELRLRPDRPSVMRLSRRALATLAGVSAIAIAGALTFALWPQAAKGPAQELYTTDTRQTPDGLNGLPRDYSGLPKPVPQLGPPLPGDLGRPMLNAGVGAPGMPQPAPAQASPEAQRAAQDRQRLAQEIDAARTSRLFTSEASAAVQQPAASAGSPVALAGGDTKAPGSNASAATGSSEADRKLAFLTGPADRGTTSTEHVEAPASSNVLQAGAVIPAALLAGLRSDLPGQITAQVTEAVFDSPTGKILLIPQGARLIGQYDAQVAFGQSRALLVWTRLVLPNGRSIVLERQPGADAQGYAGLQDRVDNHWGALFKAALLSTILSVGSEAGSSNDENSLTDAIRRGASDSISETGRQVVGRSLQVQPTITVRPGFPVRVIVTRDLVPEPYQG